MTEEKLREYATEVEADKKTRRCLEAFRALPSGKQDELLILMDAFLLGAKAAEAAGLWKAAQ